jgi:hypothetical protein
MGSLFSKYPWGNYRSPGYESAIHPTLTVNALLILPDPVVLDNSDPDKTNGLTSKWIFTLNHPERKS